MDTTTTLIGAFILSAYLIPIFYIEFKQKNLKNNSLKLLKSLADNQQLSLSQTDFWHLHVIGMDEIAKKLIFIHFQGDKAEHIFIDLNNFQKSELSSIKKTVQTKSGSQLLVSKIAITLISKQGKDKNIELVFYDENESQIFRDEQLVAEKWQLLLKKNL
jgi:hypothetical protein